MPAPIRASGFLTGDFMYILIAILIFGFLIFIHELGHFLTAKALDVQVNEFSICMGPAIVKKQRGETLYALRCIPVGGYCAMEGEDGDTGNARAFTRQGFWKKFVILAAGAFMNFLTGLLIVAILFSSAGTFFVDGITGLAPEVSRTGENGLQAGDQIYKINGWRTYFSGDAQMFLSYSGDTADIEVVRDGRHILVENVARQTCTDQQGEPYQGFGLYVGRLSVPATVSNRIRYTWYQTMDFVQLVWFSLGQLVTGGAGLNDLSGPVGIVTTIKDVGTEAQESAEANNRNGLLAAAESIAYFAALIAVNLAVMNLLPLPALDGGRIFFLLVDAVSMALFKRKVPEKYQAAINTAGFVLLMGFMLLVTFQDVFKLVK